MEPSIDKTINLVDPENKPFVRKKISWVYVLIILGPTLLCTIILGIIAGLTPMGFLEEWQIWYFIFSVPFSGLIGGFFLKRHEVQKSLITGCFYLTIYMALVVFGVAGILEVIEGSSSIDILFAFIGGILYGGIFGLVNGVFLILTTLGSYGIVVLIKRK